MADTQQARPTIQINTRQVISGAVLMGLGGALALAGVAMAGTALVAAYRERVQQMEVPPSALARQNWNRFKAATAAGVGEWRNGRRSAEAPAQ